jgi:undecaprenyl-diphosphatase
MIESITAIDRSIIHYINSNLSGSFISGLSNVFTFLGYYGAVWIVLLLILCVRRNNFYLWRLWGLSYLVIFFALETGLKNLVQRSRPFMEIPGLVIATVKPSSYSFPSSHAALSGAALVIFFYALKKRSFLPFIALLAVLISLSRVFLMVHYPSDVLAGFLLGMIIPFAISLMLPSDYLTEKKRFGSLTGS